MLGALTAVTQPDAVLIEVTRSETDPIISVQVPHAYVAVERPTLDAVEMLRIQSPAPGAAPTPVTKPEPRTLRLASDRLSEAQLPEFSTPRDQRRRSALEIAPDTPEPARVTHVQRVDTSRADRSAPATA